MHSCTTWVMDSSWKFLIIDFDFVYRCSIFGWNLDWIRVEYHFVWRFGFVFCLDVVGEDRVDQKLDFRRSVFLVFEIVVWIFSHKVLWINLVLVLVFNCCMTDCIILGGESEEIWPFLKRLNFSGLDKIGFWSSSSSEQS